MGSQSTIKFRWLGIQIVDDSIRRPASLKLSSNQWPPNVRIKDYLELVRVFVWGWLPWRALELVKAWTERRSWYPDLQVWLCCWRSPKRSLLPLPSCLELAKGARSLAWRALLYRPRSLGWLYHVRCSPWVSLRVELPGNCGPDHR